VSATSLWPIALDRFLTLAPRKLQSSSDVFP
jgi:hypothetical protein